VHAEPLNPVSCGTETRISQIGLRQAPPASALRTRVYERPHGESRLFCSFSPEASVIRSIDVAAIARVTVLVQDVRRQLDGLQAEAEEVRKQRQERLENGLRAAQELIVEVVNAIKGDE
jgi:hypothetical protein